MPNRHSRHVRSVKSGPGKTASHCYIFISTRAHDRVKILGKCKTPGFRYGVTVTCAIRGRGKIVGLPNCRIPWPTCGSGTREHQSECAWEGGKPRGTPAAFSYVSRNRVSNKQHPCAGNSEDRCMRFRPLRRLDEMATSQMSEVIPHLRRTVLLRGEAGLTDGQLLEDYVSRREEAALTALVWRHGPMV